MRFRVRGRYRRMLFALSLLAMFTSALLAQTPSAQLRGQVADPSGAVIPGATVSIKGPNGPAMTVKSGGDGQYEVQGLAPGRYTVSVAAKGFSAFTKGVDIAAGQEAHLDVPLEIEITKAQVVVEGEGAKVDTGADNNSSAVVLKGSDLDALSDDPDDLQNELLALAGPAAGPNGGQIYIDGFTGGQLPPKASIREIRINQNPFSAQYDRLGYGRVEVFTKPGTDKFHGQVNFNDNNSIFNSRNPFLSQAQLPDYQTQQFSGNLGGPINKKASFFFNIERRNINEDSVVNATMLDAANNPFTFTQAVPNPRTRTNVSPRIDYQLTANNTLTARYQFVDGHSQNDGVGQLSLISQAYNTTSTEHTFQVSDTQILSPKVINETRFEYERTRNDQTAVNTQPAIIVLGAFTGGGNPIGENLLQTGHYELQNYTSMSSGNHFIRFGGRLRVTDESNVSTQNFNGTFTFASLAAFQFNQPNQFSIVQGQPLASNTLLDAGLYAEDDWRARPNLTFSYGLRYETQNDIHDHADLAPRVGFAWGLGRSKSAPKTVLRAGFGVFYDRFTQDLVLQAQRLNGVNQQETIIPSPQGLTSTTYQVAPNLRAPYIMQESVAVERQAGKIGTVSVTYLSSRGLHQLLTDNINAPNPANGARLNPNAGNIYQYESAGIFKQNQLVASVNVRAGARLSLFGYYVLGYANSDTGGAGSFPSDQFDIKADYGRSPYDIRNRVFLGGTIALPMAFRLSPFMVANSGRPYNITVGQDLNGDSIFNDRPAFASSLASRANVVSTPYGLLDKAPIPGETIIPVNLGVAPAQFTLNMRVSKTFGLGPKIERPSGDNPPNGDRGGDRGGRGGPGGGAGIPVRRGGPGGPGGPGGFGGLGNATNQRYNLTFSGNVQNVFNDVNVAPPIGNVDSPLFGHSNALAGGIFATSAANRRITLQAQFSF